MKELQKAQSIPFILQSTKRAQTATPWGEKDKNKKAIKSNYTQSNSADTLEDTCSSFLGVYYISFILLPYISFTLKKKKKTYSPLNLHPIFFLQQNVLFFTFFHVFDEDKTLLQAEVGIDFFSIMIISLPEPRNTQLPKTLDGRD